MSNLNFLTLKIDELINKKPKHFMKICKIFNVGCGRQYDFKSFKGLLNVEVEVLTGSFSNATIDSKSLARYGDSFAWSGDTKKVSHNLEVTGNGVIKANIYGFNLREI